MTLGAEILNMIKSADGSDAEVENVTSEEKSETSSTGSPLEGTVLGLVNDQYFKEAESAESYYMLSAYFADLKLNGFAKYFRESAEEERVHAMKFFDYLVKCNVRIVPRAMEKQKVDFDSLLDAGKFFLQHEKDVTQLIHNIAKASRADGDYETEHFIQWFLNEQLEEVRRAEDFVKKAELAKDNGAAILALDEEFGEED